MLIAFAALLLNLQAYEQPRVVPLAEAALAHEPTTVTSVVNPHSSGGPHDFSSEGDYWWPDPKNPKGPYIRRDGQTNPNNFIEHRRLLFSFAREVGALTTAYDLTRDERFSQAAVKELRAWFVNQDTRMNPNLQYAQSIQGVCAGRGTGIIDTVHLAEVALGVRALHGCKALDAATESAVKEWFRAYLEWISTHPYGVEEEKAENNHGTCWVLQASAFALLVDDQKALDDFRRRFKEVLLPKQMASNGSFPLELARTKAYGYSIFNLDVMSGVAVLLSTPTEDLMTYQLADGRSMVKGVEFLAPFIADKSKWIRPPDVMCWDNWPIRQPALLFGGFAAKNEAWLALWKRLPPDSDVEEIQRNFPIRFPSLWHR